MKARHQRPAIEDASISGILAAVTAAGGARERRNRVPSRHRPAEPQAAVARVERLLRVIGLRRRARHRVQRDPRGGRADRRQPALQVRRLRPRRAAPRRPGHHPRRDEAPARAGLLHAVVRRARQGHRRWHGPSPRRRHVPLDRRRSPAALAADELVRAGRRRRRRLGRDRGGRAPGPALARRPGGRDRRLLRRPALLPPPPGDREGRPPQARDRRLADRLHRRPGLRAVGRRGRRGDALERPGGRRRGLRDPAGRACSRSTSSASRPG